MTLRLVPSLVQIKFISSTVLLKEEILRSGTSRPVRAPHRAFVIHKCPAVELLPLLRRSLSVISNLLAPNDAPEAAGLEGRCQGERSLWVGRAPRHADHFTRPV